MNLSPKQIENLYKIIHLHIYGFIAENIGSDILVNREIEYLKQNGINVDNLPKRGLVDTAFKFGVLSTIIPDAELKKMKYKDLKNLLTSDLQVPLSKVETYALDNVRRQAYSDIKGLGNRIEAEVNSMAVEVSKEKRDAYEKVIKDSAEEAILNNETTQQLKSKLGHKTGDWSRDFTRIADYIMHDAYDRGRAEAIKDNYGKDAEVYRSVYQGACKHCIRLYLTNGIGSEPKIFKLSELEANGSNIGVKVVDWNPVLGSTHPFCRCTTNRKPEGYLWNQKDQMYSIVDTNWKPKHKWKAAVPISIETSKK